MACGLLQVVEREHVQAHDAARVAHADVGAASDVVAAFKAGHLGLPFVEDGPRVLATLNLRAGEIGSVRCIGRHAGGMDVALVLREGEDESGAVEVYQAACFMRLDEHLLRRVLRLFHRHHVADAEMHRQRHERLRRDRRATGPVRNVAIAGAIDDLFRLHPRQTILVRDDHCCHATFLHLHIARDAVVEHFERLRVLKDQLIGEHLEVLHIRNPHAAPIFRHQLRRQVVDGFRPRLRDAQPLQQLQRDAFHDKTTARLVDQPVKVRQPHRRDDAS